MKFKVLNDLTNDGVGHYFFIVAQAIFRDKALMFGTILITLACILIASCVIWYVVKASKDKKEMGLLISIVSTFTLFVIVTTFSIYTVIIMSCNHYYGRYEADVHPVAVHNEKKVSGKWQSIITLEDNNKNKVKVKIDGHKLSKQAKIIVSTPNQLFNGRELDHKPMNYGVSKRGILFSNQYKQYHYTYKGHTMDVVRHLPKKTKRLII